MKLFYNLRMVATEYWLKKANKALQNKKMETFKRIERAIKYVEIAFEICPDEKLLNAMVSEWRALAEEERDKIKFVEK